MVSDIGDDGDNDDDGGHWWMIQSEKNVFSWVSYLV